MIQKAVSVFCKLAIFCVVMRITENFAVRAPKCRSDNKHNKTKDDSEAFVSILQILHLLGRNGVRCAFHHKS